MTGIREHIRSQTRRIRAGNPNRPCCVTAAIAKVGEEFCDVEVVIGDPRKTWFQETRLSPTIKRRRRYDH